MLLSVSVAFCVSKPYYFLVGEHIDLCVVADAAAEDTRVRSLELLCELLSVSLGLFKACYPFLHLTPHSKHSVSNAAPSPGPDAAPLARLLLAPQDDVDFLRHNSGRIHGHLYESLRLPTVAASFVSHAPTALVTTIIILFFLNSSHFTSAPAWLFYCSCVCSAPTSSWTVSAWPSRLWCVSVSLP